MAPTPTRVQVRTAYLPAPVRAAAAIAADSGKSDRAIAEDSGASARTVARVRKSTVTNVTVGGGAPASTAAPAKREGKDGKKRKMPKKKPAPRQ